MAAKRLRGVCECCSAEQWEYRHSLTKALLNGFFRLLEQGSGDYRISLIRINGKQMTHSQLANFQKLRYWGLAKQADGENKGGYWHVTNRGILFARGEKKLPKWAWTYKGRVISGDGKEIYVNEADSDWEWRDDYVRNRVPH